mmetsp:Transcript_4576/g.13831  ORF Transcript_4576/g.13831 Transcript_4576/m.13831 type:complete len:88 (+) Transcript_4576:3-266(+)
MFPQLAQVMDELNLGDKFGDAVGWCIEQGADSLGDLQESSFASDLGDHLRLPRIKHRKFVSALAPTDASHAEPTVTSAREDKFQAQM